MKHYHKDLKSDVREEEERSEVSVSTSVFSDVINNRNKMKTIKKMKLPCEEENEKTSDYEEIFSFDGDN